MSSSITKGPVLPFDAANTNRKCNKICDLLALLDMGNKEEQIDFKRILRDYMFRSLESRDGHDRDDLQELTEGDVRLFATRFLDNEKISPSYQTAGMAFWPSHTFIPSSGPGPRPKKWTYAENRNGIIDFVAQIIATQRENRKKNELDKTRPRHRKRTCDERASSGRECHQAHASDVSEDDLDHGKCCMLKLPVSHPANLLRYRPIILPCSKEISHKRRLRFQNIKPTSWERLRRGESKSNATTYRSGNQATRRTSSKRPNFDCTSRSHF